MSQVVLNPSTGFGAFGKIPSVGDFFRLHAPPAFVRVWDLWLQESLLDCQQAFDMEWDDLYMSAPIWRFSLSPGLAGSAAVMGVLMPSVDRVGRRFPLTLVRPLDHFGSILTHHFQNTARFLQLEDIALAALDDMPKDTLQSELDRLSQAEPTSRAVPPSNMRVLSQAIGLSGAKPDLAAGLLGYHYRAPSLWTTELHDDSRLIICEGLPRGRMIHALMNLAAPIWSEAHTS